MRECCPPAFCENFNIDGIRKIWKSVASCRELVRESSSQMIGNQGILEQDVRMNEEKNADESIMY